MSNMSLNCTTFNSVPQGTLSVDVLERGKFEKKHVYIVVMRHSFEWYICYEIGGMSFVDLFGHLMSQEVSEHISEYLDGTQSEILTLELIRSCAPNIRAKLVAIAKDKLESPEDRHSVKVLRAILYEARNLGLLKKAEFKVVEEYLRTAGL